MGVGKAARRWAALLALPVAAAAVSLSVETRQLRHDAWVESSGTGLGQVEMIARGADGYLWLQTSAGLLRFDGMRFSVPPLRKGWELPAGPYTSIFGARDGSVWMGLPDGLARLRDGRIEKDGAAAGAFHLEEGPGGALWALNRTAVWRREPGSASWRRFTAADGLPAGSIYSMGLSAEGDVWLGQNGAVCRWRPGSRAVCSPFAGTVLQVVSASSGVYAAGGRGVSRVSGDGVRLLIEAPGTSLTVLPDREGNVWVGTTNGLYRLRGGTVERFTRRDGLTSDIVIALREDAEGDLWVGTGAGLDRLRDPRVLHLTSADGLATDTVTALAAASDGEMWFAGDAVTAMAGGRMTVYTQAQGVPGRAVYGLYKDRRGVVWIGADRGVARLAGSRFVTLPGGEKATQVFNFSEGPDGVLWGADPRHGVWRIEDGRITAIPAPVPDVFRILATDGAVWMASYSRGVAAVRGQSVEMFDAARGVGPGPPRALFRDGDAVWIGAGRTLSRVRNGKVTVWGPRQGFLADQIQDVATDARGGLWVASVDAVLRISRAELDRAPDGIPGPLHVKRYDARDGLYVRSRGMPAPRMVAAPDGRIWIAETVGVGILDPKLLQPDPVPPPVHVEQIAVDGVPLEYGVRSFRGRETHISYTGISLRAADRVRFRYRLEPGSRQWTDADLRREVTFVDLAPDTYRFRVVACNLDDVCNEAGEALEFRVIPYFYQTIWFKLLAGAALGLMGWSGHRVRLRQIQARFRLAAQERARVTREIHDTLLQGFAGVVYQLDAAERMFESRPEASKERLQKALGQADNALTEARKTLQDMRLPVLEDRTLPEALEDAGKEAVAGTPAAFAVRVHGGVAELPYTAQAAMFLIGREAIRNAANHANAGRIAVVLNYRGRKFEMRIEDDGSGFDPAEATQKEGHFGVASMGERAKQVGAEFRIDTARGKGTIVRVSMARKPRGKEGEK